MVRSQDGQYELTIDGRHRYQLQGQPVPGVTTFIKGSLAEGEGLAIWRSLRAAEYMSSWWARQPVFPSTGEVSLAIRAAPHAYRGELDLAGRIGTAVHNYVEIYDLQGPDAANEARAALAASLENGDAQLSFGRALAAFGQYESARAGLKRLASEGLVASVRHRFAGTFDRLAERAGRIVLSDFKTSKAIHFSHLVQLGAYSLAIREWLGIKVQELEVLRFGKDGVFEPLTVVGRRAILRWEQQAVRCRETYEAIRGFPNT